jgi:hypothetical protein
MMTARERLITKFWNHALVLATSPMSLWLVYYLIFTPVALLLSAVGIDPLERKWDSRKTTYRSTAKRRLVRGIKQAD